MPSFPFLLPRPPPYLAPSSSSPARSRLDLTTSHIPLFPPSSPRLPLFPHPRRSPCHRPRLSFAPSPFLRFRRRLPVAASPLLFPLHRRDPDDRSPSPAPLFAPSSFQSPMPPPLAPAVGTRRCGHLQPKRVSVAELHHWPLLPPSFLLLLRRDPIAAVKAVASILHHRPHLPLLPLYFLTSSPLPLFRIPPRPWPLSFLIFSSILHRSIIHFLAPVSSPTTFFELGINPPSPCRTVHHHCHHRLLPKSHCKPSPKFSVDLVR